MRITVLLFAVLLSAMFIFAVPTESDVGENYNVSSSEGGGCALMTASLLNKTLEDPVVLSNSFYPEDCKASHVEPIGIVAQFGRHVVPPDICILLGITLDSLSTINTAAPQIILRC